MSYSDDMKQQFILFWVTILISVHGVSQEVGFYNIPFEIDQVTLKSPYLGGIRAAQFSNIDINRDGALDLFLFDREGGVPSVLIAEDDGYRYDESYRNSFPPAKSWMLLRDYNNDGLMDIFCSPTQSSVPGIEVWKGVLVDDQLTWEIITFSDRDFNILYVPLGSSFTQIYVSPIDLPEIKDVDGDGDIDILSFEPAGLTVYYYQNMAVERGLPGDALEFTVGDVCYGKFVESGFSESIDLSTSDEECANRNAKENPIVTTRHSGSTVTSFDPNADGLIDLLIGDVSSDGMVFLQNNGTMTNAWMTYEEVNWPENPTSSQSSVDIELFNAAYGVSILGEDKIVVTPNDRVASQTDQHVWIYSANEESGAYQIDTKSFLLDDIVALGKNSKPAFLDYNFDGRVDIVVGSNGKNIDGIEINPRLYLFENTGSITAPSYTLVDEDYLNFSQFSNTSKWFAPTFGDLDGDKDIDLIVGDDRGQLYYVENQSGLPNQLQFKSPVYNSFGINVSAWAVPVIYDWNQDGLGDLIIGEQNFNSFEGRLGSLNYYQNIGSPNNADFNADVNVAPNDPALGHIFLREDGSVNNFSAPAIFDNGETVTLLVSNEAGTMYLYEDVLSYEITDTFRLTTEWGSGITEGTRATLALADINMDNYIDIAVGNSRGGLAIYTTDLTSNEVNSSILPNKPSVDLSFYPNPTRDIVYYELATEECEDCELVITAMDGRSILRQNTSSSGRVSLKELAAGAYVFKWNGKNISEERIVTKID